MRGEHILAAWCQVTVEWGERLRPLSAKLRTGLMLIYAKQPPQLFCRELDPATRVGNIVPMLHGAGMQRGALERLLRLVRSAHDTSEASAPAAIQRSIDHFFAAAPKWRDPSESWVFFSQPVDVGGVPGSVVYRHQMSGNCFMHAPVVVLHY
jgi:hypothetical protein